MIVKLHGNSGSGKTTIARGLLALGQVEIIPGSSPKRPAAYRVEAGLGKPLFILGPYTNVCGGLDSVGTWREAADLLHRFAPEGHVFYEGLLSSTYYGSFGKETERYGDQHIFAFMDTPLEMCIERVKQRRLAAGNTTPLNEDNTRNRAQPIANVRLKCKALGRVVVDIRHDQDPLAQVIDLFKPGA